MSGEQRFFEECSVTALVQRRKECGMNKCRVTLTHQQLGNLVTHAAFTKHVDDHHVFHSDKSNSD